jgi:molecular chaperone DnaK
MKEHADKLDAGSKSAIESAVARVKEAEKSNDAAAIKSAVEGLEQATHALSKHMYEAAQAAGGGAGPDVAGAGPSGGAAPADDNVIDAEFEKK